MSSSLKAKEPLPPKGEQIVARYFKCMDSKDLDGILDLFDYDAVLYEPFSNITDGLKGRSSIEPFLKVAMMANHNLERKIRIEKPSKPNKVTAFVTFEKGDKVKSKFTFEFQGDEQANGIIKIKSLRIEFF
jgi:hypothetical protein